MAKLVFILCAITSISCAFLLIRAYMRAKLRLLLWCCLCFVGFAINNVLLFIDLVVFPEVDLSGIQVARGIIILGGIVSMVFGMIWDGV